MKEMYEDEAKKIYGSRLFVASLAVVQEPCKIRVVHDGSNGVHVKITASDHEIKRGPRAQGSCGRCCGLRHQWAGSCSQLRVT